jgi:hypothetical protein
MKSWLPSMVVLVAAPLDLPVAVAMRVEEPVEQDADTAAATRARPARAVREGRMGYS